MIHLNESTLKLRKEGVNVIIKRNVADITLTPKDIITNIEGLEAQITQGEQQLTNLETQKQTISETLKISQQNLKDISKFKEDALIIQKSKAKTLIRELFSECKKNIEENYQEDKTLNEEQNNLQRYAQLQRELATNEKVAQELAPSIIRELFFKKSVIDNPFG